ncbi:MAG: hypothetical protein WAS07_05910 [Micropruina sp.]
MSPSRSLWRLELPYTAVIDTLEHADLDLSLRALRDSLHTYATTDTVIDTADHRLLAWGLQLSRTAETGEWHLKARGWEPVLPEEQSVLAHDEELPGEFAALVHPFRRSGLLGPRLTVDSRHFGFALINSRGRTLAELADARVTVRVGTRGANQYRQVNITNRALSRDQLEYVLGVFVRAGATPVSVFPSLPERLGVVIEHTGLDVDEQSPIDDFVGELFRVGWRRLLFADLPRRLPAEAGQSTPPDQLRAALQALHDSLGGVAPLLRPEFTERFGGDLAALLADRGQRSIRLSERYFRMLDSLAEARDRVPLQIDPRRATGPVLRQEIEAAVQVVHDLCSGLDDHALDLRWERAKVAIDRAAALVHLSRQVLGKPARTLGNRLAEVAALLDACITVDPRGLAKDLQGLSAAEIFDAGREYERAVLSVSYARRDFVDRWPALWRRLRRRVLRP